MLQFSLFSMEQDPLLFVKDELAQACDRYHHVSNKDWQYFFFGPCIDPAWSLEKRCVKSKLLACHTEISWKAYQKADAKWQEAYFQRYGHYPLH